MTDALITVLYSGVLLFLIARSSRMIENSRRSVAVVFFLFACVSLLASNLYWIVYDLMRPETRMPFAANEIGEWAAFLLLSAVLNNAMQERFGGTGKETICAALFSVACICLWIAWSGEWIQDILAGAAFGYLLCTVVRAMKCAGALSLPQWSILGIGATLLIGIEAGSFFVPEAWKAPLDLACSILMLAGILFFLLKFYGEFRKEARPDALLSLSFGGFTLATSSMYMSADYYYIGAFLFSMVMLPLMLLALKKEVEAA